MEYIIQSTDQLEISIEPPASKSISNRALILSALSDSTKKIKNLSECDDTQVMIKALSGENREIDIKAAGTAMRFLTAYLSTREGEWTITGSERMKERPIKVLVEALRDLGADIDYLGKDGYPPLRITGKTLQGGEIEIDNSVSSQYISALLMIAPTMTDGLELHLKGKIVSEPYIHQTIEMMREYGVDVDVEKSDEDDEDDDEIILSVSPQEEYSSNVEYTVESDWSSASYWYEMMALCYDEEAEVSLKGLLTDSLQGDSAIDLLFDGLGVRTTFDSEGVVLTRKTRNITEHFEYDFSEIPDMAQTVVVTCTMLGIPFSFSGLQTLKIKETDRLLALQTELRKFGYVLKIIDDCILEWDGERCEAEPSPIVETYNDHRMAMAFAPLAFCFSDGVRISNPEVVIKSYPHFWDDIRKAGLKITEI